MRNSSILGILIMVILLMASSAFAEEQLYEISMNGLTYIYDEPYEAIAVESLADLDTILTTYRDFMGTKNIFSWPVLLEGESSSPSGYVSLPVARTVWELSPYDSFFSGDSWLHLLALHEGRHMIQYETINTGVTNIVRYLGGNQLMTSFAHALIPSWIFEGDAVVSETIYSEEGRGRSADFERRFKALLLEKPEISWEELTNGSYIHNMPNQYVYGYYMLGYLLNEEGPTAAGELFQSLGRYPIPFISPTIALSGVGGRYLSPERLFELVKSDLIPKWERVENLREMTPREEIYTPSGKGYSYISDYLIEEKKVSIIDYDRSQGLRLKEVTDNRVEDILSISGSAVDISENYVTWIEHRPQLFEKDKTVAVLVLYDRNKRTTIDIGEGRFIGLPYIDEDDNSISIISYDPIEKGMILSFDIEKKLLTAKIPPKDPVYLSSVIHDGDTYYVVVEGKTGRELRAFSLDGSSEVLYELGHHYLYGLSVDGNKLYFSSDITGIQEIYSLDLDTRELLQLTTSPYGVFDPEVVDGILYAVETTSFDKESLMVLIPEKKDMIDYHTGYVSDFYEPNLFNDSEILHGRTYEKRTYNELSWALNPYALGVQIPDQFDEIILGVKSADPYIEWVSSASVGYIPESGRFTGSLGVTHSGDVLLQSLTGAVETDFSDLWEYDLTGVLSSTMYGAKYGRSSTHQIGVYGVFGSADAPSHPLRLGFFDRFSYGKDAPYRALNDQIPGFDHELSYMILPEFPLGNDFPMIAKYSLNGYLPSIFTDHLLQFSSSIEWRNTSLISTTMVPARGYERNEVALLVGTDGFLGTSGVTYELPILYPDFSMLSSAFIKRVRGSMFYDISYGGVGVLQSAGIEILVDMTLFNQKDYQFSSGLRISYRFTDNQPAIELILLDIPIMLTP